MGMKKVKKEAAVVTTPSDEAIDGVGQLLVANPGISASAFFNLLKSSGYTFVRKTPSEADSGSSNAQALRPGVKKEHAAFKFRSSVKILESAKADPAGTKFRTILIQEGLGNLNDRFYYTKQALQSAVPVFEGKKIYADHPSSDDEQTRPERSVRDILGYFENVGYEESSDGRGQLVGDVHVLTEHAWARELMRHSVDFSKKFPDKDFVGLSINASGDAVDASLEEFMKGNEIPESALKKMSEAKDQGIEQIRVVSNINEAVSCDLVTEAGAGGKVLSLLEEEKRIMAKKVTKESEGFAPKDAEKEPKDAEKKPEEKKPEEKPVPTDEASVTTTDDGDSDPQHDDEKQDIDLIKKVLAQLGGEETQEAGDEDKAMAAKALKCAKEVGYEGEEAAGAAGTYMKMAKAMAKQSEAEGEEKPMESKESVAELKATVAKLTGQVASLTEKDKHARIEKYLDSKLAESKLPRSATDKVRESIGPVTKLRDEKQVDAFLKNFIEGWTAARSEPGVTLSDLMLSPEKSVSEGKSSLNLNDCIIK